MPLPDLGARLAFVRGKFTDVRHSMTPEDVDQVAAMTEGYSMADLTTLVKEVAMMPLREVPSDQFLNIKSADDLRPSTFQDVETAMK